MIRDEWLDFTEKHNKEIQAIRSKPIELWFGKYCVYVTDSSIHYVIRRKKEREYMGVSQYSTLIRGGKGNQTTWTWTSNYIDADGNEFSDLYYWENDEVAKEEWLGDVK